jgi:hypothetical protein
LTVLVNSRQQETGERWMAAVDQTVGGEM